MELTTLEMTHDAVRAGYRCACGCTPETTYHRGGEVAEEGCCCGNRFALGPGATARLTPREGFHPELLELRSPWGEGISAAWLIGPSVHPPSEHDDRAHADGHGGHGHGHDEAHGEPAGGHSGHGDAGDSAIDPVCAMTVDRETALAKDLHVVHDGMDHYFCGKGCKLEFLDDPQRILDPSYRPSM